ncbi:hypothetical protein Mapa_005175 [Marchantia paleacea]|nr:hypothetical protein Mapa_005175 [Marchantia paleacea]
MAMRLGHKFGCTFGLMGSSEPGPQCKPRRCEDTRQPGAQVSVMQGRRANHLSPAAASFICFSPILVSSAPVHAPAAHLSSSTNSQRSQALVSLRHLQHPITGRLVSNSNFYFPSQLIVIMSRPSPSISRVSRM